MDPKILLYIVGFLNMESKVKMQKNSFKIDDLYEK